jgi:serine protease Do
MKTLFLPDENLDVSRQTTISVLPEFKSPTRMTVMASQISGLIHEVASLILFLKRETRSFYRPTASGNVQKKSRSTAALIFVITSVLPTPTFSQSDAVSQLKEVQQKVERAVQQTLPACIAISDGVGFGSGVVVTPDGLVLTAGHVMGSSDKDNYEVIFPSGRTVPAKPLGKNLNVDAGMLQLIGSGPFPYVKMSETDVAQPGDWVITLGHSGGFELGRKPPVRVGRILRKKQNSFVTDAILIGGDSGGPLFNLDGELIAIHTSIGDITADNRHVPLSIFRRDWTRMQRGDSWGELPELNEPGDKTKPGRMGINVDRKAPDAKIRKVTKGSAADEVGLAPGDVVVQFDNVIINDGTHLIEVVKRFHEGDVIPIKIRRGDTIMDLEIQLQ